MRFIRSFVATSFIVGAPIAAQAATVTFTPTADGDVQTFGGDDVDTADTVLSVSQSGGNVRNGILEYDLSSIDDAATIDSASLTITITRFVSNTPSRPGAEIDIFSYLGDGVVDITDYDAPGTQIVDTSIAKGGSAGDTFTFLFTDVSDLQSALAGDDLTLRIETDSFASIQFAAIENTLYDAATLSVTYTPASTTPPVVPLPASLPLLMAGVGGLACLRRRKGS